MTEIHTVNSEKALRQNLQLSYYLTHEQLHFNKIVLLMIVGKPKYIQDFLLPGLQFTPERLTIGVKFAQTSFRVISCRNNTLYVFLCPIFSTKI